MAKKQASLNKVSVWQSETLEKRLNRCRAMLIIYGLITDKQSDIIKDKIDRLKRNEKI